MFVLGLGIAATAVESLLQVRAYLGWRNAAVRPGPVDPLSTLCVGDDLSFGSYLQRERAFPAHVERLLRLERASAKVVDHSAPRMSTADALRALPRQLAIHRPARLIVALGSQDAREGVDPVALDQVPGRTQPFRPRFQMARWLASDAAPAHEAFVGTWHTGTMRIEFAPDGTLRLDRATARWELSDERLWLHLGLGEPSPIEWAVEGDLLTIDLPGLTRGVPLRRGEPKTVRERIATSLALGDFDAARAELVVARTNASHHAWAERELRELSALIGRSEPPADDPLPYGSLASEFSPAELRRNLEAIATIAAHYGCATVFVTTSDTDPRVVTANAEAAAATGSRHVDVRLEPGESRTRRGQRFATEAGHRRIARSLVD